MKKGKVMHNSPSVVNEVKSLVKAVDLVLEVLDARAPQSTQNPAIGKLINTSQNLVLLNKADLAEEDITNGWLEYYRNKEVTAASFHNHLPPQKIFNLVNAAAPGGRKGKFNRPQRIMVLGVPNVGKSTIVNALLPRKTARTGDKAGITKGKQWIRIRPDLELLDTPGLVQPFINEQTYFRIALLGVLPESQLEPLEAADWLLNYIIEKKLQERLQKRYGIDGGQEKDSDIERILGELAAKRGCLQSGGEPDLNQAAQILLKEFREGKLGPFSLEEPGRETNDLR